MREGGTRNRDGAATSRQRGGSLGAPAVVVACRRQPGLGSELRAASLALRLFSGSCLSSQLHPGLVGPQCRAQEGVSPGGTGPVCPAGLCPGGALGEECEGGGMALAPRVGWGLCYDLGLALAPVSEGARPASLGGQGGRLRGEPSGDPAAPEPEKPTVATAGCSRPVASQREWPGQGQRGRGPQPTCRQQGALKAAELGRGRRERGGPVGGAPTGRGLSQLLCSAGSTLCRPGRGGPVAAGTPLHPSFQPAVPGGREWGTGGGGWEAGKPACGEDGAPGQGRGAGYSLRGVLVLHPVVPDVRGGRDAADDERGPSADEVEPARRGRSLRSQSPCSPRAAPLRLPRASWPSNCPPWWRSRFQRPTRPGLPCAPHSPPPALPPTFPHPLGRPTSPPCVPPPPPAATPVQR